MSFCSNEAIDEKKNLDAFELIGMIFKEPVKPSNFYNLKLDETIDSNKNINFNDILMNIFFKGIEIKFGNEITPTNISKDQYTIINTYMNSFGYNTEFGYTYNDENIPTNLNVWFEKLT
jgi:hypothetical protein